MRVTFVKLTIEMKANPGKFQELHQTLEALLPMIRGQKGCRDCRISRDIEDEEVLTLAVDWDARRTLNSMWDLKTEARFSGPLNCSAKRRGLPWAGTCRGRESRP